MSAKPKKAPAKKKANGYDPPKFIPTGTILVDTSKQEWKIGKSIGSGGFGDIYSATKVQVPVKTVDDYPFVVKIEPHANGPLFVEMHFYMRSAKLDDIEAFKQKRKIRSLGMPHLVGSGSHDQDKLKHRFVVMPRYGRDLWSIFLENDRKIPLHTIYRLALQMIDVLDYIHGRTYVHADLKGANILMDFTKDKPAQAYLVDFGLASHYIASAKEFKPDPKKMHNGTIEYTSRDAHNGVPTMRSDMEILAYNLIEWCGTTLPWVAEKLLTNPVKVQQSKEVHMKDPDKLLAACFHTILAPPPIKDFVKYVASLKYDQQPDYKKCVSMFEKGLKELGKTNAGPLEFRPIAVAVPAKNRSPVKAARARDSEPTRQSPRVKRDIIDLDESSSPEVVEVKRSRKETTKKVTKNMKNIRIVEASPQIVVNNEIGSKKKAKKTYELNLELDVSIDASVIVNVKRKKKTGDDAKAEKDTSNDKKTKRGKISDNSEDDEDFVEKSPVVKTSRPKPAAKTTKKTSPKATTNRVIPAAVGRAGEYKGKKAQNI